MVLRKPLAVSVPSPLAVARQAPLTVRVRRSDPEDMLDPAWRCPLQPRFAFGAAVARAANQAFMRPVLAVGQWGMGSVLHISGFRRYTVPTAMGRLGVFDGRGAGTLPPIVLVLGIGGTSTDYFIMLRRLLPHFQRVLIVDLPGHGVSGPVRQPVTGTNVQNAMNQALDTIIAPLGRALVLGHSLGGYLAARFAMARPERVRGLILVGPTGAPFDDRERHTFKNIYSLETQRKARLITRNAFWGDSAGRLVTAAAWARLSMPVAQQMINSELFSRALEPAALASLRPPVLLVWGQADHLLPVRHLHYFLQHLPASRELVMPPHVNHNNPATGPAEVIDPVVTFARRLAGQSGVRAVVPMQHAMSTQAPLGA